jgi:predicted O-methyltransferase YrrM
MNTNLIKKYLTCSGEDCFNDDFFNRNLSIGNITHASYKGISIEQNPNIIDVFNQLINDIKPSRILEIGTFAGGLTLIMRDLLDLNNLTDSDVITYDVNTPHFLLNQISNIKITSKVINLFSDNYLDFKDENSKNELIDIIGQPGVTLVLCDGGSKKNEFNLISSLLKKGDVIMAHDYAPNDEYFQKNIENKLWNWLEIQDSDINESCVNNNLKPYMEEDFRKVVWVCKIKE